MFDERGRSRVRAGSEQPIEALAELFLAELAPDAGDDPALGVENRRGGNGRAHGEAVEVVGAGADPDGEVDAVRGDELWDFRTALGVVERSGDENDAARGVLLRGVNEEGQLG